MIAPMAGTNSRPRSVSAYSTDGGEVGITRRVTTPFFFNSRNLALSTLAEIGGMSERNSPKRRGPARRMVDPRDQQLAEQARELSRWKKRAERAEALVELQKQVAALLGTPITEPS